MSFLKGRDLEGNKSLKCMVHDVLLTAKKKGRRLAIVINDDGKGKMNQGILLRRLGHLKVIKQIFRELNKCIFYAKNES